MAGVEFSFNWFYADDKDIALFSSGRLPVRAPGTDPALPTDGSGAYDWRGFLTPAQHAQAINPANGEILNWNNKPAADVGASDDNWSFGSIQRVQLLQKQLDAKKGKLTLADVASAMNGAATQDLRAVVVLPDVAAVLKTGAAPSPRAAQMLQLLEAWEAKGASRLDLNLDGKVDDPGAAIMDAVWDRWADAVMTPVLGADARRRGSRRSTSAATTRTPAARRTSTAGTATSTRTCARCSGSPSRAPSRRTTAAPATSPSAARRSGPRSTRPAPSSPRPRAPTRPRGARTRRRSGSGSPRGSSRRRCAGRTARPSSRSSPSAATARAEAERPARRRATRLRRASG